MKLVIVESPAKAKTINKYLGPDYQVLASYGHVRDLPSKNGSVDPNDDFAMLWEVDDRSQKRLSDIAKAIKDADGLILATDPDREGEAISWHVLEVLKNKKVIGDKPVERVVFNAITRDSVLEAMKHPRRIDVPLVDAYLARRALDYLVGFTLSPVLWRKLPGARSAGRVQSVALRLVCDRENEIEVFKPREYWSIAVTLEPPDGGRFIARVVGFNSEKLGRLDIPDEATARRIESALKSGAYSVTSVEAKPVRRNPPPPFTTSTLQQEASRKLGFAANRTMQVAQRLYEDGYITYMRTDGVQTAPEAISAARATIAKRFGQQYVPDAPRLYQTKAKNAQEAHEAIRPADLNRMPDDEARSLEPDQARLYELIWKRMTASQMASAELERTTVDIAAGVAQPVSLRATGQVVRFDGFLTLYQEGRDEDSEDEDGSRLPPMKQGDRLTEHGIATDKHFTEPPPRYTEATLIKKMEELGIGRPSTYAATLSVLRDREYVRLEKRQLVPEDKGRLVTAFLESFFERYVEYDFTADLEEKLDKISNGDITWKDVLRDFWRQFSADVDKTKELRVSEVLDHLNELARAARLPGARRRRRPPPVPELRHRQVVVEDREIRCVCRLLELSGVPIHPPARHQRRERRRGLRLRRQAPRHRSRDRPRCHAPHRPLRSLRPARRAGRGQGTETEAGLDPTRLGCERSSTSSARSRCCGCRAKSASTRRPASRSPPASAATVRSFCTTAPSPTSTRSRKYSASA